MKRIATALAIATFSAIVPMMAFSGSVQAADPATIYNSIPSPLPGNLPSVGGEAYAFSEFGDQIAFAGTSRILDHVVLTLSSWGCQAGHWNSGDCSTTPGATFSLPITFNIYAVGLNNSVGGLIASKTQTFAVPYRPSADNVNCTGADAGKWYDAASASCFNGLANNVSFDFSSLNVTLPNNVIYGIAYNTTHYGYSPVGESAPCYTSSGGCGYDSLNIALATSPPSVGMDVDPTRLYQNSPYGSQYCDNGLAGTNSFRLDSPSVGCWAPYTPSLQFVAKIGPPTSKDQCKDGGWKAFNNPTFKNQGDCVSYVATRGKHGGNG